MKIAELKNLAALMRDYDLTRVEISQEGSLVMERRAQNGCDAAPYQRVTPAQPAAEPPKAAPEVASAAETSTIGRTIVSPMVGVFYTASSPEAEPFVKKGDNVKKGDVLCIIEAMKLMNEITAEEDSEILEVLVQNGQLVEYGQPLFRIG